MDTAGALQGIKHATDSTADWRTVLLPFRFNMSLSHSAQNQRKFLSLHRTVSSSALEAEFSVLQCMGNKVAVPSSLQN